MSATIRKKIEEFLRDGELQERFESVLEDIDLKDVIWPERRPDAFGKEFKVKLRNRVCPYPLWETEHRITYIGKKIDSIRAEGRIHPALAFYYLSIFQEDFKPPPPAKKPAAKKTAKKKASKKKKVAARSRKTKEEIAREAERKRHYNRIQRIKGKLAVSPALKRARTPEERQAALLNEFQSLTVLYAERLENLENAQADLEVFRNPDYMHPELKKTMTEIVAENANLKILLNREQIRAESMEREVNRLTEQLLSQAGEGQASDGAETIRREYEILSQKYDSIVSKNIELVNRLEKFQNAKGLEKNLDLVRDKINGILRAGVTRNDDVLLKSLRNEVDQIVRARTYLGRALYDIGMLYLRLGRKTNAIREFRAARELGVEDPETNRLLNH